MEKQNNENLVELTEELRIELEMSLQNDLSDTIEEIKPLTDKKKKEEINLNEIKIKIKKVQSKLSGVLKLKKTNQLDIRISKGSLKRIKKELKLLNLESLGFCDSFEESFDREEYSDKYTKNREQFAEKKEEQRSIFKTLEEQQKNQEVLLEDIFKIKTEKKELIEEKKSSKSELKGIQKQLTSLYGLKYEITSLLKKLGNLSVEENVVCINPDDFLPSKYK